jgi:hypothetical protein
MRRLGFSWVGVVLTAVSMFALAGASVAAEEETFLLDGKYEITAADGDLREGTIKGKSEPGGKFTGAFVFLLSDGGQRIDGRIRYLYDEGVLVIDYSVTYDADLDAFVGTFKIVGGEGVFWGATGGGAGLVERGNKGKFSAIGTIVY